MIAAVDLRTLRAELIVRFRPRPLVYAVDLSLSAAIGWASLWTSAHVRFLSLPHILLTVVAVLALLRAGFFLHEVAHQRKALPWLGPFWSVVVGAPLLMPAFMLDAHVDHHRLATFGTADDPEYERRGPRWRTGVTLAATALLGVALATRALVIGPLSLAAAPFYPKLRAFVRMRMSTLATNERYKNMALVDSPRVVLAEVLCAAIAWAALIACARGALSWSVPLQWLLVFAAAAVLNQARTQAAHGYESDGAPMSLEAQVADSTTTLGPWWITGPLHPLGTRFHALHHLAPSVPYHALAGAHRWLVAATGGYPGREVWGLHHGTTGKPFSCRFAVAPVDFKMTSEMRNAFARMVSVDGDVREDGNVPPSVT